MGNDSTRRNDLPWNWRVPVRRQNNVPRFRALAADTKANESRDPLQRAKLQTMWGEYVNAFEKATFVTDALGTLALLNVLAEELIGFQQSEVVGLHIGELLFTPQAVELYGFNDLLLEARYSEGVASRSCVPITTRDGDVKCFDISAFPLIDGERRLFGAIVIASDFYDLGEISGSGFDAFL